MAAKVGIKDVLNQEIAKAEALKEEAYTPESYAAFKTALDAAKAVQNTEDVTEDVVNEAVKNLLAAKEKLVKTGEVHCILDLKFEKPEDLTVVKDSSENAFDSEATGIEEADYIEGVSGTGLQFNGKTLYNIPAGANLATPSITLSYWIKRTGKMEGDSPILWAKKGWNEDGFYTNYPAGDSYSSFFVVDGFNGFSVKENPNEFLPENEWTHIAVTWDADSKTGKIYKNGVEQEIVFEGTPESITGSDNATNTMGDNGYQNSPTANLALDEFRIYDSAVNAEAVKALYDEFMNAPEADKKELQALFDSCQSIDKNLYTEESIAKMEEAMNAAYDVLADENATQSEVDNAKAALQKAISELALIEEPKVDKSALQAMFDEYQGVDSTLYTEESMEVFVEAMNKAAEVLFNEEATQEEVDGMVEEFRAAYEGLKLKEEEVIKAALQALYDEAQEIDTEAYTAESVTALTEAMQRAEEVLADEEATQEEVDAVTNDLQSAINGLIKIPDITPVDKGGLEKVIAEAKEKKQEDYTGESWAVFVNALQKAEDVYKNAAAKQEEVDAQKAALQEAMDALVKAGEPKADTTELVAALEKAKGLNKPDYTAKSWAVLEKAVADGNSILQNPKAKQKDVDAAVEAIHAAINGLVKATESPANPNPAKPDKPGNTNNQSTGNKVATGDTAPIFALIMSIICAMAAAVVAIVLIRRNRRIGRR